LIKRKIGIFGSTGSIGTQTLEVIRQHSDLLEPTLLVANNNIDLLVQQAKEFVPDTVVIANKTKYKELKKELEYLPIKVYCGKDAIREIAATDIYEVAVTAMVGISGLEPTISAIKSRKAIALANKETMVVAGELISKLARENFTPIIPIDSEHSAIFQCLQGNNIVDLDFIYLTASGGPFRGYTKEKLAKVKLDDALKHPNWSMGKKVTIDSSTLMNKGLEVIEAKWLFNLPLVKIKVAVHPQSIIHSMVQFNDGNIMAQIGPPDMRLPITYALTYPNRLPNDFKRFNLWDYPNLSFEQPDLDNFPCLNLAYIALNYAGTAPCILNAVNEIAVESFIKKKIKYLDIPKLIDKGLHSFEYIKEPTLDDILETDLEVRKFTKSLIKK
jgi:1-deoxy-D-xylulose-5-phosphate reductoisomerase